MDKIRIIAILLLVFIFIVLNIDKKVIETKKEIIDFELVEVIGIDIINEGENKIELSFVRNKQTDSEDEETSDSNVLDIISIKGTSFNDALRQLQPILNKHVTNWHVKYFIIGNETAKSNIINPMDFLIRDNDTKFNSRLYISKDMTAKEFLNTIEKDDYKFNAKIQNMEKNNYKLSNSDIVELTDFFKLISSQNPQGVIPTLEIYNVNSSGKEKKDMNFAGYAIFDKNRITDYLDLNSSRAVNFIQNKIKSTNIDIYKGEEDIVSLGIIKSKCNIKFQFDEDNSIKCILSIKVKSNIEESNPGKNIYTKESIQLLENRQSEIIGKEIYDVVSKAKESKSDFLKLNEQLRLKHPYKWNEIKDNWEDIFANLEIEINVDSTIRRTYDIISEINY